MGSTGGHTRRARAIVLAGFALGTLCLARSAHAQLEIDQLELYLRPGALPAAATFTVRNTGTEALTVQISLSDWNRGEDGTNYFTGAGALPGSCHPDIRVFPATTRLAPEQSQSVQVIYQGVPRTTSCWSSVRVALAGRPPAATRGAQLIMNIEHQIKVYVEPPEAKPALELMDVDIVAADPRRPTQSSQGAHQVTFRVRNPGAIQTRVKARIEYRTLRDSVVSRQQLDEAPILPGATRTFRSALPLLSVGRYVVLVLLDYGAQDLLAGQIDLDLEK